MGQARPFSLRPLVIVALSAWGAALALMLLPKIVLGSGSLVHSWDYLDSFHAWNVILARTGTMFAFWSSQVPSLFDTGVPRVSLGSQFSAQGLLYLLLPPYWVTVVAEIIARAIGFCGMYRLVSRELFATADDRVAIAVVAAACFSLFNYMPGTFLSIIGLPMLAAAIIAICRRTASPFDFAYVAVFPFASSLALVGLFLMALVALACLVLLARARWAAGVRLMMVGATLAAGYAISDYGILALKLSGAFETQRSLRAGRELSPAGAGLALLKSFFTGIFHANPAVAPWALMVALAGAVTEWFARPKEDAEHTGIVARHPITACLVAILVLGLLAVLPYAAQRVMPMPGAMRELDFKRWIWLAPPLYYLAFGIAAARLAGLISGKTRLSPTVVGAVLVVPQIAVLLVLSDPGSRLLARLASQAHHGTLGSVPPVVAAGLGKLYRQDRIGLTYEEYYSPRVFDAVERLIGRPRGETRLATIGSDPFIANYNGFQTTDGYFQLIPISLHARVQKVIEGELARDKALERYFTAWGNRVYLYAADLYRGGKGCQSSCIADRAPDTITLSYDPKALAALHIDALLSVSAIANAGQLGLTELGVAQAPDSAWRFHVYRVGAPTAGQ
ncbi:DUF6044 family protein [Xanthobacter tagetidis]|jgi:hypothetical protein|uniref:DUF6044 family protein n=1 Tax=Xanthobacter tagetidis TaxID=60216 RepID=UPI0011C41708|nr:DUF6044 family protein [Xanthobacter tagetidis]MBB6309037.1 hypothetical protein [Xanthobacter tagetidis]